MREDSQITRIEVREAIEKVCALGRKLERDVDEIARPANPDKADPGKALDLMAKLAEYAAPKLARTEHTGPDGGPQRVEFGWAK